MTSGNSNSIKGSLCWITDVPLLQWSGHCNLFLWVDMIFHLINDTQTPNCQKKNTLRKVYANVTEPQNTFLVGLANSKKHGPFSKQNTPINTAVTALNRLTDCSCLFLFFLPQRISFINCVFHVFIRSRRSQYQPVPVERPFPYLCSDAEKLPDILEKVTSAFRSSKSQKRDASLFRLLRFMSRQNTGGL